MAYKDLEVEKLVREIFCFGHLRGDPSLENIKKICQALGNPQESLKTIHVAGTNGKGSTSTFIEAGLYEKGYSVGKFSSPHILSFNERITYNTEQIPNVKLKEHYNIIREIIDSLDLKPSFFEVTTGIMFSYFAEKKPDYIVLECGLGGRFDATNICQPLATIITNISLDHLNILGHTLKEIASEKAGILNKDFHNNPLIILGEDEPELVEAVNSYNRPYQVINYNDIDNNSKLKDTNKVEVYGEFTFELPLLGQHQKKNFLCAYKVLRYLGVSNEVIAKSLPNVKWPGRLEKIYFGDKLFILDGAHNIAGVDALLDYLRGFDYDKPTIIFASLKSKTPESYIQKLYEYSSNFITVPIAGYNSYSSDELKEFICAKNDISIFGSKNTTEAIKLAIPFNQVVVVCGSFYLISKLKEIYNEKFD